MFFMSVYRYPNVRSYWGRYSLEAIRTTMSRISFEQIRQFLHFNDNSTMIPNGQPGYDKLHRVRPLITHFNERFGSVPMLHRLCVDEQMCATKMGGSPTRQYTPAKPKWRTKLFVLCDHMGFSYSLEIYSGAGDNVVQENASDLGASSNVVDRLSNKIPDNVNHIVYFDNFYTSLCLLTYLRSRGIYSLGTVRSNRVPNIKLSSDAELTKRKVERGYSEKYVAVAPPRKPKMSYFPTPEGTLRQRGSLVRIS
ncbi:piggyBac transposable element-derived protein 1-like [Eupeodes corollae]|uniref:piggyBac transposable element-derived protein 1-like n=1 Tax=Eupeodes corollae TaxID=290404 RepID=UPI002490FC8E|nr:piggyBac transposable element-derived protein 1-like [Eupeodes corollae]